MPKIGLFNTTVFRNVAYGLKIRGLNKREIRKRAEQALELVGLVHKKNMNALALSSGESQRLGIARAMAIEPEMLFLDEPTASLDPETAGSMRGLLRSYQQESGATMLMASHNMLEVERLCDDVIMLRAGRVVDRGAPAGLLERYSRNTL